MLSYIDNKIEKTLKKHLYKRRKKIIEKTLRAYCKQYNPTPRQIKDLETKLTYEAERACAIADRSILRTRLKQAKYTFWITLVTSIVIIGILGAFSHGTILPFLIPILSAITNWIIATGTIPISYNQRIKGSMDAIVAQFNAALDENITTNTITLSKTELDSMKTSLRIMSQQLADTKNKLDFFYAIQKNKLAIDNLNSDNHDNHIEYLHSI